MGSLPLRHVCVRQVGERGTNTNCRPIDHETRCWHSRRVVMVMNLYSAFSIGIFKCALQACDLWVRSDISIYRRLLAAAISPLAISPSTWMNAMRPDHNSGSSTAKCGGRIMLQETRTGIDSCLCRYIDKLSVISFTLNWYRMQLIPFAYC